MQYEEVTFVKSTEILLTVKRQKRGDDGHKIVSVRMKEDLLEQLDKLSSETHRSRNEIINILLEHAVQVVKLQQA